MEFWDVLDGNGSRTGRTIARGEPLKQDEYHLVVDIWIQNSKGEYLISKRTANKTFPNMWETTGGSAITGEDSLQAALREAREEIGIELNPQSGKLVVRLKRQHDHCPYFRDTWLFHEDVDISRVVCQPEEVCDAKWATQEVILSMIESGEFVDVFTYVKELFTIGSFK